MHDFHLETERLIIRNWNEKDRDLFHFINSDDRVMEFFSIRRNREQSHKMMDDLRKMVSDQGYGYTAIALKETNEAIGFCGLSPAEESSKTFANAIEIGWRLAPQFWGRGYATEAAKRLLQFGFKEMDLPEIMSFAVPQNIKSIAVMQRIGMSHIPLLDFDHPDVPDTHPELKRHVVYAIENK